MPTKKTVASKNPDKSTKNIKPSLPKNGEKKTIQVKKKAKNSKEYNSSNITVLKGLDAVKKRPGMYIGKLGDGSSPDDGIYILLKEIIDNCIDEYIMGAGKTIDISIKDQNVTVRDYGRGIPQGKLVDVVSKMNTGGK